MATAFFWPTSIPSLGFGLMPTAAAGGDGSPEDIERRPGGRRLPFAASQIRAEFVDDRSSYLSD
jgi:hypothetical protein